MPLRRRMIHRRRRPAHKKVGRKMMRRRGAIRRQVHKFKRQAFLGTYTASNTSSGLSVVPIQKAFSFQLTDLPNYTEFTNLFDQYKINGVALRIIPKTSVQIQGGTSGTTAALGYGEVVTVIDYDTASAPGSKNELLEYGSVKVTKSNRVHTRFLRPKLLNTIWRNSLSSGYAAVPSQFIDEAYTDIPHYGIRWWADAPASTGVADSSMSYDVYATYYITCKNVK